MLNVYTQFVQVTNSSHKFSFKLEKKFRMANRENGRMSTLSISAACSEQTTWGRSSSDFSSDLELSGSPSEDKSVSIRLSISSPHQTDLWKHNRRRNVLSIYPHYISEQFQYPVSHLFNILPLWSCTVDDFALQPTLSFLFIWRKCSLLNLSELSRCLGKHSSLPGDWILLASSQIQLHGQVCDRQRGVPLQRLQRIHHHVQQGLPAMVSNGGRSYRIPARYKKNDIGIGAREW